MLEKKLQQKVIQICRQKGIICVKVDSTSTRGWPDLLILTTSGETIYIELKTPSGRLSKLQQHTHDRIRKNNGNVYTIRTEQEFIDLLNAHP